MDSGHNWSVTQRPHSFGSLAKAPEQPAGFWGFQVDPLRVCIEWFRAPSPMSAGSGIEIRQLFGEEILLLNSLLSYAGRAREGVLSSVFHV